MRKLTRFPTGVGVVIASLVAGCGSFDDAAPASSDKGGSDPGGGATGTGTGSAGSSGNASTSGGAGGGSRGPNTPPEVEVEKAFEAPVATARYVWAANPKTGRVALIDSSTFQVKTVAAGEGPTFIAAIPSASPAGTQDRAIVLNVLSNDATLLTQTDGKLEQKTIQVAPQANAWAISPDGKWAISWTDAARVPKADKAQGFQKITVIDLRDTGAGVRGAPKTVGFRPKSISFASDPPRAFAVTEDGIDAIELPASETSTVKKLGFEPAPNWAEIDAGAGALPDDAGATDDTGVREGGGAKTDVVPPGVVASGAPDVSITPKGEFAIVSRAGSAVVTAVDLAKGTRASWILPGPVTDLDLSDSGDRAVAVMRSLGRVAVLPIGIAGATGFSDVAIANEVVGSVVIAPRGKTAVLYTNATAIERLTVLDLDKRSYRVVGLHAPVLSVFASPTTDYAIVVHNSFMGQAFQSPGAFSFVPLADDQSPVIQNTDAPVQSVAISQAGDRALIPVRDDPKHVYGVYLTRMPSGVVDRFPLASPPTAAGFVGASGLGFIAQEHPEGRVAFIDPQNGHVRTITGFELGASVVEWSPRDGGQ